MELRDTAGGDASFACVQLVLHHLLPTGISGFVLANGSLSSIKSGDGETRQVIVEADLIDCMVALRGQLFDRSQIPACRSIPARDRLGKAPSPLR